MRILQKIMISVLARLFHWIQATTNFLKKLEEFNPIVQNNVALNLFTKTKLKLKIRSKKIGSILLQKIFLKKIKLKCNNWIQNFSAKIIKF